jgi:hypothetical protein
VSAILGTLPGSQDRRYGCAARPKMGESRCEIWESAGTPIGAVDGARSGSNMRLFAASEEAPPVRGRYLISAVFKPAATSVGAVLDIP